MNCNSEIYQNQTAKHESDKDTTKLLTQISDRTQVGLSGGTSTGIVKETSPDSSLHKPVLLVVRT